MMALPGPTALTSPVALTVATAVFEDEYDIWADSVTSRVVPSAKVPEIVRYSDWPWARKGSVGGSETNRVGVSARSTLSEIALEKTVCPAAVFPMAVRLYFRGEIFVGIVMERVVGTDALPPTKPPGPLTAM
jgi:hypothetical protein